MITLVAEPGTLVEGATILVSDAEAHHLRVRRGTPAEAVRVVDGCGAVARGRPAGPPGALVIERVEWVPAPPPALLAVGAGDRDRVADLVEVSVALGATRVVALDTEHSRSVATRLRDKHRARLELRALEAAKQCGAAWVPALDGPMAFASFLAGLEDPGRWPDSRGEGPEPEGAPVARRVRSSPGADELGGPRWLADPSGGPPEALGPATPVVIAVGPEGGFAEPEREALLAARFRPVRVGPHTLRFEAAAAAALVLAWHARQGARHG